MELNEALNKCCERVRDEVQKNHKLEIENINLKRQLKAEIQMRKKAESYYKELEGFLEAEGENNG